MSLPPDPLTAARALLAGPVPQPKTMTHAEIWALLATYQRRLAELADHYEAGVAGGYVASGLTPRRPADVNAEIAETTETVASLAAEAIRNLQEITKLGRRLVTLDARLDAAQDTLAGQSRPASGRHERAGWLT
jgi:hypothetical protein